MNLLRHIGSGILCFTAVVCCYSAFARPQVNPLLDMIGKECGTYFEAYESLSDSLFSGDSLSRAELVRLFVQAAGADPTGEWELDRRRIEGHVRFFESRRGGYMPSSEYTAERFTEDLLAIARTAERRGFTTLRLRTLFNAADVYRIFAQDYERAFTCYLEAVDQAAKMPLRAFPWKFSLYLEIGDFYFSFREYDDAARFYSLIADDPEATSRNNHKLYSALNGLGLCYRSEAAYDKSDSCFRRILDLAASSETDRYLWEGIAGGNIGFNHYLRGEKEKALSWMKPALTKMKRPNDDSYTCRLASNIADVYLERNDLGQSKKYLDIALDYHRRSRIPQMSSLLLGIRARYNALSGNRAAAMADIDSALRAKEREQEAFSGLVLRRVEQQLRAADRKVHEQRLGAEKMRSRMYRQTALLIAGALAAILMLLILVSVYYRRTRKAYRELVRRSQQWAGVEPEHSSDEELPLTDDAEPAGETDDCTVDEDAAIGCQALEDASNVKTLPRSEEFDRTIMHAVEQAVIEGKMFKQADLTLDMLAAATGYNRYYLSSALNRCTGGNFNTYVNELRIKEAVRVMSDPANGDLTVDAIAYDAGFNDRKNFYRVFKKVTGLSPTQFRRNTGA